MEARKPTSQPQKQRRRRRGEPASPVGKVPHKASVHPHSNPPRGKAAKHVPRRQSHGTRTQRRTTRGHYSLPARRDLIYHIARFHGSQPQAPSKAW
ncbi:Hypothetical predicted protein, partial [Pelobates cultripes]